MLVEVARNEARLAAVTEIEQLKYNIQSEQK